MDVKALDRRAVTVALQSRSLRHVASKLSMRSIASCLRVIAYQIFQSQSHLHKLLARSSTEMLQPDEDDAELIWRIIYERILFKSSMEDPLFWIINALDECDSPALFLECLSSLSEANIPVRVTILSCNTQAISPEFKRLSCKVFTSSVEETGQNLNQRDVAFFVEREMRYMHGSEDFRRHLTRSILARSHSNFL